MVPRKDKQTRYLYGRYASIYAAVAGTAPGGGRRPGRSAELAGRESVKWYCGVQAGSRSTQHICSLAYRTVYMNGSSRRRSHYGRAHRPGVCFVLWCTDACPYSVCTKWSGAAEVFCAGGACSSSISPCLSIQSRNHIPTPPPELAVCLRSAGSKHGGTQFCRGSRENMSAAGLLRWCYQYLPPSGAVWLYMSRRVTRRRI